LLLLLLQLLLLLLQFVARLAPLSCSDVCPLEAVIVIVLAVAVVAAVV
jgi:hypothetical protein